MNLLPIIIGASRRGFHLPPYIAWYKFDDGSINNIIATIGENLTPEYSVGNMTGGVLYNNTAQGFTSYASYPVTWVNVNKVTIKGFTPDGNNIGKRFICEDDASYIQVDSDGSILYKNGSHYDTILPAGTVVDGVKTDLIMNLTNIWSPLTFGAKAGGSSNCWKGSMEELIIEGIVGDVSGFDSSFDYSFG